MDGNDARDTSPPWAELPADALSEIAGHLRDEAGDFVRFHAVCRPWREAAPPPPHAPSFFLPCLIQQSLVDDNQYLHLHSPFSGKLTLLLTLTALAGKRLVSSDACSGRVLAVGRDQAVLIDPLTGDATSLPELPQIMRPMYDWNGRRATGTVSNGIVMLHTNVKTPFAVVLHRPGETDDWEKVDVTTCLAKLDFYDTQDEYMRRALTLSCVLRGGTSAMANLPPALLATRRYVVEYHGELLCLDLVLGWWCQKEDTSAASISITVHALEVNQDGRPQWVKREHGCGVDEHLCFFLNGKNGSGFTVDAREFTGEEVVGGCAYFVGEHPKTKERWSELGYVVYRYSFKDGTATVLDVLPDDFSVVMSMWYMPQPTISAVHSRLDR